MREVHGPHILIIDAVDREISKHTSICELAPFQVYFSSHVFVVNVVFTPLLFPVGRLESNREGTCHLDCIDDRKVWSSFVVKEPQNMVSDVNRGTGELYVSNLVQLLQGHFVLPVFEIRFIQTFQIILHFLIKLFSLLHLL